MRWRDFDGLPPLARDFFASPRRAHFVGIGGIGMSALALMLQSRGHFVSGSDANPSSVVESLRALGIRVAIGHASENLRLWGEPAEALIFSSAIGSDNPELLAANDLKLPCWHRSQLLAYFVNEATVSIAVSGTHGKSTTSAMIAHILERCGCNPSAILGAVYPPFGSNARIGDPRLLVVEADESDGSFTLLDPTISVVTNVEPEHLENYDHSEAELWRAFGEFVINTLNPDAQRKPSGGRMVLNADDVEVKRRLSAVDGSCSLYSTNGTAADASGASSFLRASAISVVPGYMKFDVAREGGDGVGNWREVLLGVPGEHNIGNAIAAVAAAQLAGVEPGAALETLASFRGVGRRFEFRGEAGGVVVYDDYAHHPTEVSATLEAARDFLQRPLRVVFQPHRYSRTQQLGALFGPSFEAADEIVITELYSAFEEPIPGVSGRIVYDAVRECWPDKPVHFAADLEEAAALIARGVQPGDAVLTLGAGTITDLPEQLLKSLEKDFPSVRPLFRDDEPIGRHTTIKVGGPARKWAQPRDEEELAAILAEVRRRGWPLQILGAGSNLIGGDSPLEGCALKLGAGFNFLRLEGDRLIAGGAALLPKLTHYALSNRLGNMEWACGIPGTVGGSLYGNAGARGYADGGFAGRDCAADLESLVAYDLEGHRRVLARAEIDFSYRRSSLAGFIVTEATFRLQPLSEAETAVRQDAVRALLKKRRETQPVNAASAGCVWKNPDVAGCAGAGELIESLGLKGHAIGGAAISQIHGNFIINTGNASGRDVRDLMRYIEAKALEAAGVTLEREVRLIGD